MLTKVNSIKEFRKPLLPNETKIYFCKIKNAGGIGKPVTDETMKTKEMTQHKRTQYFLDTCGGYEFVYIFLPHSKIGQAFCILNCGEFHDGIVNWEIEQMKPYRKITKKQASKILGTKNLQKAISFLEQRNSKV